MLAIASFIIDDPDDLPLHTRVPDLKSRTPLAHSNLANKPIYRCSKERWADRPSVAKSGHDSFLRRSRRSSRFVPRPPRLQLLVDEPSVYWKVWQRMVAFHLRWTWS
jgi:hypothetical protein